MRRTGRSMSARRPSRASPPTWRSPGRGGLERVLGPLLPAVAASVMVSPVAIALFPYGYAGGTGVWQEDADDDSPLL
ncbi:hypothetical protein SRIMM317S_03999 [Streptomyces rimosus subsp. rimosus]